MFKDFQDSLKLPIALCGDAALSGKEQMKRAEGIQKVLAALTIILVLGISLTIMGLMLSYTFRELARTHREMAADWPKVKAAASNEYRKFRALPLTQSIPIIIGMPIGFWIAGVSVHRSNLLLRRVRRSSQEVKSRAKVNLKSFCICLPAVIVSALCGRWKYSEPLGVLGICIFSTWMWAAILGLLFAPFELLKNRLDEFFADKIHKTAAVK